VTGVHSLAARERLLQGLRGEGVAGLSEADWDEVIELAQKHGVAPLLHRNLKARYADLQVPEAIQSRLRDTYRATGIRNTRIFAQLNGILKGFRAAGIDVVVLKGAHLAELVYEEVALRPMADVDLLVRPGDLRAATQLLRSMGYEQSGHDATRERAPQEPIPENMEVDAFRKPGGLLLDLHYAIIIPKRMEKVEIAELWGRAQAVRIGGAEAYVLSPEDLLLHLCIHAAANHGFEVTLLHLCDIPAVVDGYLDRIDWSVFWSRARAWGAERSVLVTLAVAERLLGWHRPEEIARGASLPPAPFDVVAVAERLLFEKGAAFGMSANLPRLWGDASVGEKAMLMLRRAFPSREEMGFTYGLPARSWKVPMLYPVRLGQLLARYAEPVMRAVTGGGESGAALDVTKERSRLIEWLVGS
jgi:hypothetical protein